MPHATFTPSGKTARLKITEEAIEIKDHEPFLTNEPACHDHISSLFEPVNMSPEGSTTRQLIPPADWAEVAIKL
jgi:hypothetical protein